MSTLSPDIRQKLKSRLLSEESFRQFPYTDTMGYLTVGVGRNLSQVGISLDEALMLLDNDIIKAEKDLLHFTSWYAGMDDARKSVMIDFVFNVGISGALKFTNMIAAIERKDWKEAAQQMLSSKWHDQVGKRADTLALILETGQL